MKNKSILCFVIIAFLFSLCGTSREVLYKGENYRVKVDGILYKDIVKGEGVRAEWGEPVEISYKVFSRNGTKDIEYPPEVVKFTVNKFADYYGHDVLLECIYGMKVGGKRKLVIPSELCKGQKWLPEKYDLNQNVELEISLLNLRSIDYLYSRH